MALKYLTGNYNNQTQLLRMSRGPQSGEGSLLPESRSERGTERNTRRPPVRRTDADEIRSAVDGEDSKSVHQRVHSVTSAPVITDESNSQSDQDKSPQYKYYEIILNDNEKFKVLIRNFVDLRVII